MNTENYVGYAVEIPAGTKVRRNGVTTTRTHDSIVTIRAQEPARNGKIRISWKSHGVKASTLV